MHIPDQLANVLLVASLGLSVVLLVVVSVLALRLRRLRSSYARVLRDDEADDLFAVIGGYRDEVGRLTEDVRVVHDNTEHLRELLRGVVSRVGVVRYDAFEDMGGALSFSAAFLDENGDGVVVSAINGRAEGRTYAKAVVAGQSEHHLSPEEQEAIAAAQRGERGAIVATGGRRRRRRAAS